MRPEYSQRELQKIDERLPLPFQKEKRKNNANN